MWFSSMAMVTAFCIGDESLATADERSEEEEDFWLLNSLKRVAISCCGVMRRGGIFEKGNEDEVFGLEIDFRERESFFFLKKSKVEWGGGGDGFLGGGGSGGGGG